ncbi:hypothetical protein BH20CHL2_BH20CHL2_12730 [soil metagenome]
MSNNRQFRPQPASGPECAAIRDDLGAWALDALDSHERSSVDQHVSRCMDCHAEADRWLRISSALPLSLDPVAPSDQVRDHLMHRVADDQLRSVTPALALTNTDNPANTSTLPIPPSNRGRFAWSQALVAPLVIALIAMTAWSFNLQDQVNSAAENGSSIQVTADDTMLPAGVQTFGMSRESSHGRFLANPDHSIALFVAWGMDPAMEHEVWCVDELGSEWMVASLDVSQSGDVVQPLEFEQPISGYTEIYVMSKDDGAEYMMEMDDTPMITPPPDDNQT